MDGDSCLAIPFSEKPFGARVLRKSKVKSPRNSSPKA